MPRDSYQYPPGQRQPVLQDHGLLDDPRIRPTTGFSASRSASQDTDWPAPLRIRRQPTQTPLTTILSPRPFFPGEHSPFETITTITGPPPQPLSPLKKCGKGVKYGFHVLSSKSGLSKCEGDKCTKPDCRKRKDEDSFR